MKNIILFLLFSMCACASEMVATEVLLKEKKVEVLLGGNSASVGGDTVDQRQTSAWFYGKRPIRTCYNRIESFGASDKEVSNNLKKAIAAWKSYLKTKQVKMNLNLNFKFVGRCKGDEDLALHFGTGPIFGNLKDLKAAQTLSHPIAYVNKTHLSRDLKWSKGYIRFVSQGYYSNQKKVFPNWKIKGSLYTMILHELGHVFGLSHVKNTIMSPDIVLQAFDKNAVRKTEIDQQSELVFCDSCEDSFSLLPESANLNALKKIGLSKALRILRSKNGFSLSDGKRSIGLINQRVGSETEFRVLNGNFSDYQSSARQKSFAVYSFISKKNIPLIFEYNSNKNKMGGILNARVLIDNQMLDVGSFSRLQQ